jgi:hypothetical protein
MISPMSDSLPKPHYQWRATFDDKLADFAGWDGDIRFGRIMKHPFGHWEWHLNGIKLGSADGIADDARLAAAAVEDEYDRVKAILIERGEFDSIPRVPRDG